MTRANFTVCLCVISGALFGCDTDKVARLERQNQELQALIQRQQVAANLELQSKCARDSKAWFRENWQRDKTTTLLDFTNHYNKEMNKCFIMVEYHYSLGNDNVTWMNDMSMWDIYENEKYAQFSESHTFLRNYEPYNHVLTCDPPSREKCKSVQEFNAAMNSYMNN
jgi:hypothetical protein